MPNTKNARGKRSLPRRRYRQIHTNARKRSLPQTALQEIQQTPKRGLFPYSNTGKFPAVAIPWQQGIIYSGGGAPTHRFNYFLTLFL